jgi:HEAT repeat protein
MRRRVLAVVCLMALAGGCENVSSDSIQRWKNTAKGPGKLDAAVRDRKVPAKLRAEAALALLNIAKPEGVEAAVPGLPADERDAVTAELVPLLIAQMQNGSVNEARDARDGLFSLREHATPQVKQQIDAALLPALARELRAGRTAGGRYSIDRILQAVGPAASPMLLQVLEEPAAPYPALVEVLAKSGDPETKDKAAEALVRRASALPELPIQMWRALGQIGGKAAFEYLQNKVEKGHERDAVLAAQALQQGPRSPGLVALAMRLAGNQLANRAVRDEMFGLLEHVGTPEAKDGAIRIIATDPDPLVRYRAYETALAIGKQEAIVSALEAFPPGISHKREDVVDFLVKDIEKLGAAPTRPAVGKALESRAPLARMTGVLAMESLGTPAEATAVAKLSGDKAAVKGFPPGSTIGKEATRVAGILQNKPSGGKP